MTSSELARRANLKPIIVTSVGLFCFIPLATGQQGLPLAISGTVFNDEDSRPIVGAILTVNANLPGLPRTEPAGAKTGQDGQFTVLVPPAQQYRISCQMRGYVTLSQTIVAGTNGMPDSVKPVELRMVTQAVVTGRITDSVGQPLVGATVRLSRVYLQGRRTVLSIVTQASTNDLGQYRIFGLEPGRYYVSASYQDAEGALGLRKRPATGGASGLVTEDYAVVYYPAAPDPETATPVNLRGGKVASNIDLSVGMAQSFPVSGTVAGLPADGAPTRVFLQPSDPASLGAVRIYPLRPGDPRFLFRSVPPGNYLLRVDLNMRGQVLTAREELTVSSVVDGVTLDLQAPFSVAGSVTGEEGVRVPTSLKLKLMGADRQLQTDLKIDESGRFQVSGASPNGYTIAATDDSGKIFMKSLFLDDRPAPGGWVTVLGPNHSLRIVVSDKAGQIEGGAVDNSQHPAGRGLAVLVGADPQDSQSYAASLDSDGRFKFQSLPPGKYRILCFSDLAVPEDATWDVQKRVKTQGTDVTIAESDKQQLSLEITQLDPI